MFSGSCDLFNFWEITDITETVQDTDIITLED